MRASVAVDAQSRLGECALWCDRTCALYWTDIEGSVLNRWNPADGRRREWKLPQRLGSFALTNDVSQMLLGLADGIALFNLDTGRMTDVVRVEPGKPTTRINDGRCDRQGRFVFGMFSSDPEAAPLGNFYRVNAALQVETLPLPPTRVANSIAFSPDGLRMYFTDTPTRRIMCVEYHPDGRIGTPRVFVTVADSEGFPDGSTVDAEGGLWNAQWDGGCVVRYDRDGVETQRHAVPATRPTCPAFGGAALDCLFITSARVGLRRDALPAQPHAGAVFALSPARSGLPEARFITQLRA